MDRRGGLPFNPYLPGPAWRHPIHVQHPTPPVTNMPANTASRLPNMTASSNESTGPSLQSQDLHRGKKQFNEGEFQINLLSLGIPLVKRCRGG